MRHDTAFVVAAICIAIVVYGSVIWSRTQNRLSVINRTGQPVAVEIAIGDETLRFGKIPPGSSVSRRFSIQGDSSFQFHGLLADGTEVVQDCGYVTSGMYGERPTFTLHPAGKLEFSE